MLASSPADVWDPIAILAAIGTSRSKASIAQQTVGLPHMPGRSCSRHQRSQAVAGASADWRRLPRDQRFALVLRQVLTGAVGVGVGVGAGASASLTAAAVVVGCAVLAT
jgi:hypothetical protein